jgi:hypothetical protein
MQKPRLNRIGTGFFSIRAQQFCLLRECTSPRLGCKDEKIQPDSAGCLSDRLAAVQSWRSHQYRRERDHPACAIKRSSPSGMIEEPMRRYLLPAPART